MTLFPLRWSLNSRSARLSPEATFRARFLDPTDSVLAEVAGGGFLVRFVLLQFDKVFLQEKSYAPPAFSFFLHDNCAKILQYRSGQITCGSRPSLLAIAC